MNSVFLVLAGLAIFFLITLMIKMGDFYLTNKPLFFIDCAMSVLIGWMIIEGVLSIRQTKKTFLNNG